jgi:hypothetical protein
VGEVVRLEDDIGGVDHAEFGAGSASARGKALHCLAAKHCVAWFKCANGGTDLADHTAQVESQNDRKPKRLTNRFDSPAGTQLAVDMVDRRAENFNQDFVFVLEQSEVLLKKGGIEIIIFE